jgi:AcrR family transcriptional regulator
LEAAAQVFADKGYESTTIRDIATAVDMGESTLYNYFQNKHEVLLAILKLKRDELDVFLSQIDQVDGRAGLVRLIDQTIALWLSRAHFTRALIGEASRNPEILALGKNQLGRISKLIQSYLERQTQSGRFRAIDTDLTARMIIGMFFSMLMPTLYGVKPILTPAQRQQQAETMADVLLTGIAAPPKTAKR